MECGLAAVVGQASKAPPSLFFPDSCKLRKSSISTSLPTTPKEYDINFYVTDGNIMYLTDASRFLISCVIQHYAPVVGCGGVEEQMHNVDYDPGP